MCQNWSSTYDCDHVVNEWDSCKHATPEIVNEACTSNNTEVLKRKVVGKDWASCILLKDEEQAKQKDIAYKNAFPDGGFEYYAPMGC